MKNFILINAVIFLLYGLGFLFFPEILSQFVTDAIPTSTSGLIDMRATYGGMSIAFAILLWYMQQNRHTIKPAIIAINLMVGGMALGRIAGIIIDGSANNMMYIYLFLEIVVVMLGLRLLSKLNASMQQK